MSKQEAFLEMCCQVPAPACQATTTLAEAGIRTAGEDQTVEAGTLEAGRIAEAGIVEAATVVAGEL